MSIGKIISIIGGIAVISIGSFLLWPDSPKPNDSASSLLSDYKELLAELDDEKTTTNLSASCDDLNNFNSGISSFEERLADLQKRKNDLIEQKNNSDHVPELPEISDDDIIIVEDFDSGSEPLELSDGDYSDSRPGSEVPELLDYYPNTDPRPGSEVPELLDYYPNTDPRPGSEVPELLDYYPNTDPRPGSQVPELLDYYPNTDPRPGSEMPDLSDGDFVPPLPEINEDDIVDPDLVDIESIENQIKEKINSLKSLCDEEEVISNSCDEACKKYVDCARYADDETEQDMIDAYESCMEECASWSEKTVICMNKKPIKKPLDCRDLSFCVLPEYGGPSYQF